MFWFTHEMYDDLAGSPAWNPYGSDERRMFFLRSRTIPFIYFPPCFSFKTCYNYDCKKFLIKIIKK